jgi:protein TonB
MPVFKGGDTALINYIRRNTKYPEPAKLKGIQGKVMVRFAVEADGSIDKISILKGVDPDLDKEALRVVGTMPTFEKPGIKDGKAVSVWYSLPINFTLK